jgi:hypothetical protein
MDPKQPPLAVFGVTGLSDSYQRARSLAQALKTGAFEMRLALTMMAAAALTSCAPTLGVQGKFSPQSGLTVGAYRTIVVAPFSGFGGPAVARELEARLASATFEGKPYFRVVPAPPDPVDAVDAAPLGRALGVDAVLTGDVRSFSSNRPYYEYRDECAATDSSGKCVRYVRVQIECYDADADVTVSPRLVDVKTGQIVYSSVKRGSARDRQCGRIGGFSIESQLLDEAREEAIRDIRFDLAPFERKIDVELKDSTDGLTPEQRAQFKQGMDFAKAENVGRACEIWRGLQDGGASTVSVQFNLGVCAETAGDFTGALRIYENLQRALPKPDDDVTKAVARVRGQIAERERLKGR